MTRSVWRLSHLSLALVASLFLILASISGIFLAFEPIQNKSKTDFSTEWNDVPLNKCIDSLKNNFMEVTSVEKDANGFFIASVFTEDGEQLIIPINPQTGKQAGKLPKQSKFYEWMTSFHRSLFLDTLGRFFVGLTAVILFFIAVSGIILVIQRTRSLRGLVDKVEKTLNVRFYHVVFGRLAFIPIVIISLTGGYLFLQRFEIIKKEQTGLIEIDFENLKPSKEKLDFSKLTIGEIDKIDFPLFPDEEEVYVIQTEDRIVAVDQFEFMVLDEVKIPTTTVLSNLSLDLHTGRTNNWWAFILAIACLSILYFIYSGFKMTILSLKGRTKNKFKLAESEILLLIGTETGNTRNYAKLVYQQLISKGYKVYLSDLNKYKSSESIKQLIVFTATYGTGDAPANASKFIQRWKKDPLNQTVSYSIVGFGSLAYPDFCKYAVEIEEEFAKYSHLSQLIPLVKIHNQSYHSLKTWANDWSVSSGCRLELPVSFETKKLPVKEIELVEKQSVFTDENETFTLKLRSKTASKFQSGDLLVVYPPKDPYERFYSIGKTGKNELIISVKKHDLGICSNYLNNLDHNSQFEVAIKRNNEFHYNASKTAIFIGNGTGIGPFLGMVAENTNKKPLYLYWGGRNKLSYSLYEMHLDNYVESGAISSLNLAFSRGNNEKVYVGDLIRRDGEQIVAQLKKGAIIYICGSLAMQQDVLDELEKACKLFANKSLNHYQKKGQIKMDCY